MALAKISGENRRAKSILFLICCALAGIFPHLIAPTKNLFPSITLAVFLGGYGLRVVLKDQRGNYQLEKEHLIEDERFFESLPKIDVLVAARDEENVIERLVSRLLSIEYPEEKLSLWIIDDGSQDSTPNLLAELSINYPRINVFSRSLMSGGGKSGALNSVLNKTDGEWLFILDADAQLQSNVLLRAVTLALEGGCKEFDFIKDMKKTDKSAYKSLCHTIREDGAYVEAGENDNLIVQKLQANPSAFGVFGYSFLEQNSDSVQGSIVNGVEPEFEEIASGNYPIARSLYFYVKKEHIGIIPGITEFMTEFTKEDTWGDDGYLVDKGLIPLSEDSRNQWADKINNLEPLKLD